MKKLWLFNFLNKNKITEKTQKVLKQIRKDNYYTAIVNLFVKRYFTIDDEYYQKYRISLIDTKLNDIVKINNKNLYKFEIFIFSSCPGIIIGKSGDNINNITINLNKELEYYFNDIKKKFVDKNDTFEIKITLKEIKPIRTSYEEKIICDYEKNC